MRAALERRLPLVLDGDGLFLVTRAPELLRHGADARVVITPNVNEYRRLRDALGIAAPGARTRSACAAHARAISATVHAHARHGDAACEAEEAAVLQLVSQALGVRPPSAASLTFSA